MILRFVAPIPDMDGFAPLGGVKGPPSKVRPVWESLTPAAKGDRLVAGADLLDASGEPVAEMDVPLSEVERVLGKPLSELMGRGRQALAELDDGAVEVDAFGFPVR